MSNDFWLEFATRRGMGKEFLVARERGIEEDVIRQIINRAAPDGKGEIRVTTPEISIKEVKKEVEKMNENDEAKGKANWFSFSDKQQADRTTGDWFPSFSGEGFDEVVFDREDVYNDKGKGGHPGFHRIQLRELPQLLFDEFSAAANGGHLSRTYAHFTKELEKVKSLDPKVLSAFRKYAPEVEKARTQKQQLEAVKPIIDYLGAMRREKI